MSGFVWTRTGARSAGLRFGVALAKIAPPKMPTWRRVGHADWHAFQRQLVEERAARKRLPAPQPSSEASRE
jgi:hypothetical protein